jgi:hypothetical protein
MSDTIRINDDVVYREMDGDIVAISITSGHYATFDGVGGEIWRLIDRFGSVAQIKADLLANYDLDERTCDAELREFIASLESRGLVTCESR